MDFLIHWPVVATVQCQGLGGNRAITLVPIKSKRKFTNTIEDREIMVEYKHGL